jgi:hypothetical protein
MRSSADRRRETDPSQRSIWDFVPPIPTGDLRRDLIALALQMAQQRDLYGLTIGEVVKAWEDDHEAQVGGVEMEDKNKEQRQTSWLARVLPEAGLIPTDDKRPSPLKRHHRKEQRVYVHPDVKGYKPASWYQPASEKDAVKTPT